MKDGLLIKGQPVDGQSVDWFVFPAQATVMLRGEMGISPHFQIKGLTVLKGSFEYFECVYKS